MPNKTRRTFWNTWGFLLLAVGFAVLAFLPDADGDRVIFQKFYMLFSGCWLPIFFYQVGWAKVRD